MITLSKGHQISDKCAVNRSVELCYVEIITHFYQVGHVFIPRYFIDKALNKPKCSAT